MNYKTMTSAELDILETALHGQIDLAAEAEGDTRGIQKNEFYVSEIGKVQAEQDRRVREDGVRSFFRSRVIQHVNV